eukprot:m.1640904 g.1640904  ORF g.1640904 m.1640904 type:complete len:331 (+) comp44288_c0_seq1:231-1223(+)
MADRSPSISANDVPHVKRARVDQCSSKSNGESQNIRIFVAGSSSGSGKSTVSLALLGALLRSKLYTADQLAYIKPATQGIQTTLTAKFCKSMGIACQHVGPVVFYRGFTHAFLEGKTPTSAELLASVEREVERISKDKSITIIDGVGYPAVGSVVGCSNAHIAAVTNASVLVVGKEGVGDAIDSFNLCASYFEAQAVPVIGTIINRISSDNYKRTTTYVPKYFAQFRPRQSVFGFVRECEAMQANHDDYAAPGQTNACHVPLRGPANGTETLFGSDVQACNEVEAELCNSLVSVVLDSGDDVIENILHSAREAQSNRGSCTRTMIDGQYE